MSFDLFIGCVGKRPAGVTREAMEKLLGKALVKDRAEPALWHVRYGKLESCTLYLHLSEADGDLITGLMVSSPCCDLRLWNALVEMMRLAPWCLSFPGCEAPLVAQPSLLRSRASIFKDLGRPRVVASGDALRAAIEAG